MTFQTVFKGIKTYCKVLQLICLCQLIALVESYRLIYSLLFSISTGSKKFDFVPTPRKIYHSKELEKLNKMI